ncbi:hypothetical protein LIT25_27045 (plasmid) [Bacillus sp. F19]|nr:hypothetical protein LIT25_27045 [Bacillus sp. F19]
MNLKKTLLAVPLSLVMLTPVYASANTHTETTTIQEQSQLEKDQEKLFKSKAMNPEEEKKELAKLGFKDGSINI